MAVAGSGAIEMARQQVGAHCQRCVSPSLSVSRNFSRSLNYGNFLRRRVVRVWRRQAHPIIRFIRLRVGKVAEIIADDAGKGGQNQIPETRGPFHGVFSNKIQIQTLNLPLKAGPIFVAFNVMKLFMPKLMIGGRCT